MPAAGRPPLAVLIIATLFLALGCLDIWLGAAPLFRGAGPAGDDVLVFALGIAALAGGGLLLYRRGWARWLIALWIAFHIAISAGDPRRLAVHVVIFGIVLFFLFRPAVNAWFRPQVE